jgi:hypothetical protein
MADEELLRRLDRMQATLELAFRPQLEAARKAVRSDEVNAAILDATTEWTPPAIVQKAVAAAVKASERTVRNRLAELVEQRLLEARGSASSREYRRTGVI